LIKWYPDTAEQIASKMNLYVKAWWRTLSNLVDRRTTESKLFLTQNV
jgi:GH24 family phage-related lysozyme (muramidase)